jgi:ABC-type lipoprotein release transport system permease subunit
MLLRLAWRNIWRNGRRTVITVLALAMGVAAIVGIHSFREVANDEMIRGLTRGMVGHVQVHGRGYQESPEMANVVAEARAVVAKILEALPEAQAEKRVLGAGLAGAGDAAGAVMVMGIEPENPSARDLLKIEKGRPLGAAPAREAVIGSGLAEQLGVSPGSELVLVGQAADGSLANDRFTVVGVGDAGSYEANATAVFVPLAEAQSFFALDQGVHQVIVRLPTDEEDLTRPVSLLRGALDEGSMEVMPWTEILPELKGAMDAKAKNQRFLDVIVFLIVSLGVLNTMSMSTFERTREFGVMASLGTRRRRILGMVVLEALLLGAIGFTLGVAFAFALLHGIGTVDFGAVGGGGDMMGARLPDALRLRVDLGAVASAAVTTLLTMLAGGLIPALRASRLQPIEATRYV